ncbi:MAG: hypothetical protein HY236_07885 [Acidobacteria bacterium]|nr:hypothetical protein [Acidobacteriota bacterium]
MRRSFSLLFGLFLGVALVLSLGAPAYAKEKKAKAAAAAKEDRLSGVVHMINKDTSTITIRRGNVQRQVVYGPDTKYTYRNAASTMDEVKEGRRVICLGKFNEKTQLVATRIDVREGK